MARVATAPVRRAVIQSQLTSAVIAPVRVSNTISSLFSAGWVPLMRDTTLQPKVCISSGRIHGMVLKKSVPRGWSPILGGAGNGL